MLYVRVMYDHPFLSELVQVSPYRNAANESLPLTDTTRISEASLLMFRAVFPMLSSTGGLGNHTRTSGYFHYLVSIWVKRVT